MVKWRIFTFISFFLFCFLSPFCYGADSLSLGQSISGNQTITSAGDKFVLGFFNPGNSQNHYIGIWYNTVSVSVQTIVWVANRENPITNSSSGVLQIGSDGNLVILDGRNISLWSTNSSSSANSKPIARLLDSGNLVLIDDNSGGTLWQSFDYPTDTLLPGMKFGMDLKTGHRWSVVPWKRSDDPSPGGFIYELDPRGWPQFFVMNGLNRSWRTGPWNGRSLSGIPEMYPESISSYTFVNDNEEISFSFTMLNSSIISRFMVATDGTVQRFAWLDAGQRWLSYWLAPGDQCDIYGACGPFSFCTRSNSSFCSCLQGFEPKSSRDWLLRDWPGGCVRRTELGCGDGDGFLMLTEMELPDSSEAQVDKTLNLEECRVKCLSNCSCTAYANSDVRGGGSGCVIWVGDLIDLRQFSAGGQNLYLRLAASELGGTSEVKGSSRKKRMILEIGLAITLSGILLLVCCGYYMFKKRKFKGGDSLSDGRKFIVDESSSKKMDLPLFSFGIIEAATCNFSDTNKLGEGGFGPVYKGRLLDGQDIAVKRLAKCSTQGIDEFENEVMLIVKLQHRNLVRLLGFCTHGEERILVYEYLHNKSLDSFLFEKSKSMLLDWKKRLEIIVGIARGLLYLHEDSRLRIIHRDLKSSNILLDVNMNPKISDFGLARIFGGDQIQANTNKVAGTYGYMAPEYAMEGIFSVKSDVFSFGVLVLEILSGKKINNFYSDESSSLIGYAWKLWQEAKGIELLDLSMGDSYSTYEVLKCIHIGLLCVQESPGDRPNMSSVVNMLGSELTTLPPLKKPAFSTRTTIIEKDPSSVSLEPMSINSATITIVEPR